MLDVRPRPGSRNARMPRPTEIKVMHFRSVAMCLGLNGCSVKGDNFTMRFQRFPWFSMDVFPAGMFSCLIGILPFGKIDRNILAILKPTTHSLVTCFQVSRRGKFEFRCSIFRSEWRFGAKRTRCSCVHRKFIRLPQKSPHVWYMFGTCFLTIQPHPVRLLKWVKRIGLTQHNRWDY